MYLIWMNCRATRLELASFDYVRARKLKRKLPFCSLAPSSTTEARHTSEYLFSRPSLRGLNNTVQRAKLWAPSSAVLEKSLEGRATQGKFRLLLRTEWQCGILRAFFDVMALRGGARGFQRIEVTDLSFLKDFVKLDSQQMACCRSKSWRVEERDERGAMLPVHVMGLGPFGHAKAHGACAFEDEDSHHDYFSP